MEHRMLKVRQGESRICQPEGYQLHSQALSSAAAHDESFQVSEMLCLAFCSSASNHSECITQLLLTQKEIIRSMLVYGGMIERVLV